MAWFTKYRTEFMDEKSVVWTTDIQESVGAQGTIYNLTPTGSPLSFEWYGSDDIFDQNIMGSKMNLNVYADSDFILSDLFTSEVLQFKVIVYKGATIYWNGFIVADNYTEPYDQAPMPVTISANDGLGILKSFTFKALKTAKDYTGRQQVSRIIYDILSLVGISTYIEYVNVYESTMNSGSTDSALYQLGVDTRLFKTMDCYTVLDTILKSFNAGIKQDLGVITIYRYKELKNDIIYGRIFTTAQGLPSPIAKSTSQYIKRPTQPSNFLDYEGGTLLISPKINIVNINQDYGFRGSILDNPNFPYDEFIFNYGTVAYECDGWLSNVGSPTGTDQDFLARQNGGAGDEGLFINNHNTIGALGNYVYQTIGVPYTPDPVTFTIKAGGRTFTSTSSAGRICAKIKNVGAQTRYFNGVSWVTTDTLINSLEIPIIAFNAAYDKDLSFQDVSFTLSGLQAGSLTIYLYAAASETDDVYAAFKNVNIYCTRDGIDLRGVGYSINNGGIGKILDKEFLLGDGYGFATDPLQFAGAYSIYSGSVATSKSWHTRLNTENIPLAKLLGEELAGQYNRPKQIIDLPVSEIAEGAQISSIGNIQDVINTSGGNSRRFAININNFQVKERRYNLTLTELI